MTRLETRIIIISPKMNSDRCEHKMTDSIKRHLTQLVKVGHVLVGKGQPVVVQSMTDTATADVEKTVRQIIDLHEAGSEIVRLTVNDEEAAAAVPIIHERLLQQNVTVPLVGDFHYNGHTLLTKYQGCAEALAKYRINPGNVGFGDKRDKQFEMMVDVAIKHNKPVRIGVNWGSLDEELSQRLMDENAKLANPLSAIEVEREAVIRSALQSAVLAEKIGLAKDKIIISCKVSKAPDLIAIYRELAKRSDYTLHLGLTEAGMGIKGTVASAAALAPLLLDGIGDTIRVSLTPAPGQERTTEVRICQEILQSLEVRSFMPAVSSCPGCGRTTSTFFRELADQIQRYFEGKMPVWRKAYPGVETLKLAVMGCIVNGPGESKHADIGISLPGSNENPAAPVFIDGKKVKTLRGDHIAEEFTAILENYVAQRFGQQKVA